MDYARLYHYRFQDIDQKGRTAVWDEIADFIYKRAGNPERVLDPACGRMEFINAVPSKERWGSDIYIAPGIANNDIIQRAGSVFEVDLPTDYFDAMFVSNFLEHLPTIEAVHQFLKRAQFWLKPGGRIVVMGPNFKYCADEYFDCADHALALTHVSVAEHLYAAGFEIETIHPRFLPYSFRSLLPASGLLTAIYLKFPLFWRLLGKQFLIIAKRTV